jgi:putative glycosyltransferase
MKISVVAPLYKSAPYIAELHRRCVAAIRATGASEYEIIFVNDAGPDDSLVVARRVAAMDHGVTVIDLARNAGQHRATMTGLAEATGDFVFVMDSDLEDEPEWITLFFKELTERNCDVVYGINNNLKGGRFYSFARALFYFCLNKLSSVSFPPNVCSARLMSRRYVGALLQFTERELFMAGIWHMAGFTQLPIEVTKRDSSPTTFSTVQLAGTFVNAITAFSTRPLAIISLFGIILSVAAFSFTGWIVVRKIFYEVEIEGWASVMAAVLTIGGLTLFFNGVMAIYIAKIFIEVKHRPRSIIKDVYRCVDSAIGTDAVGTDTDGVV